MALKIEKKWLFKVLLAVALLSTLPMLWVWTPLNRWLNFATIITWQESIKNYPGAFFFVMGVFVVGSLVLFPISVLNVATIFTFGPIRGNLYALAGWLLSGAMGFAIGRGLGHETLRKLVGSRLDYLIHQAGRHGFLTVLTIRVLPLAPFTIGNLFVGSSGIGFRDFILASIVGRIPGLILMTVAGVQIENALRNPAVGSFILLVLTLILVPLGTALLAKRLSRAHERRARSAS
jgi:phospholipase D1/2